MFLSIPEPLAQTITILNEPEIGEEIFHTISEPLASGSRYLLPEAPHISLLI